MSEFNKYFDVAIKEAKKAFDKAEVPVGCVIVDKNTGKVISKAYNKTELYLNSLMHAEIIAITKASKKLGKNLSDCIAFVTLPPCIMCATAFTYARIDNVYYCTKRTKIYCNDDCKNIYKLDKSLHKTNFHFISNEFTKISENLLKNFFHNLRSSKNFI